MGASGVGLVLADASMTTAYEGAVPAAIALVCGVFGNVKDEDVRNTIRHLPELCCAQATVIWTRGRFEADLTPSIRAWFLEEGVIEVDFAAIPETTAGVGGHQLTGPPRPFRCG